MRTNTNLRISHTVYPDGLRIDYDYCKCDEQIDIFWNLIIVANLLVWVASLYLIFR
jgi:hypothetical protein